MKECMLKVADILCPEKNGLAANIYEQLTSTPKEFKKYSIAIDESTCRSNTVFCAVFVRGVNKQACITEELLDLIPMKRTMTG